MSTEPEALRLADVLDDEFAQGRISNYNGRKAAAELRRLHEVNQDLLKALHEALETDLASVGEVGVWGEWQGLTDEDYKELSKIAFVEVIEKIERVLKEKNA